MLLRLYSLSRLKLRSKRLSLVYYNAATKTWHMLFQCLAETGPWNGCHVQRAAVDPMGPFVPIHANPVLRSAQLWRRICDQLSDDCSRLSGGPGRVFDTDLP